MEDSNRKRRKKVNREEAQITAEELVSLYRQRKEISSKITDLKGKLLEYMETENLNDNTWVMDNACVEVTTVTRYKLADIPADVKISPEVAAIDIAEKAFKSKVTLTKEGKKMFLEREPSIVALMIPKIKKEMKITI